MRIVVSKPKDGKTRIVVRHNGVLIQFRHVLEDVDIARVSEALRPVLDEYERQRDAVRPSPSL